MSLVGMNLAGRLPQLNKSVRARGQGASYRSRAPDVRRSNICGLAGM